MTYTLTVAVGRRLNGDAGNWGIEIMTADQTPGSQYLARLTGTYTDLTAGEFVDKTVTFTPTFDHPNLGQNLRVHLWSQGIDGSHTSTAFDNVRLGTAADTSGNYAAWQTANGTTGTLDQDHDADGVPNGIEYFLYGNTDTTGFTALPPVSNNSGVLSVTWTKAADYAGAYGPAADFVVQTSDTLTSWSPASTSGTPNIPDTVYLNGNDVTYTFPSPLGAKKFARLKVTGP